MIPRLSHSPDNNHINEQINVRITFAEIEKQLKLLKINKSSGIDFIMNEHIKSAFQILGPIFEKLFNTRGDRKVRIKML